MGNIKGSDASLCLNDFIANNDSFSITKDLLEEILNVIVPKDLNNNNMIGINIRKNGRGIAVFHPQYESISLSIDKLYEWVNSNSEGLANYYGIQNSELFKKYLVLMALTHETEHSYQYLMGMGKIVAPCKMLEQGYKTITELFIHKDYVFPRPIKQVRRIVSLLAYKKRENEFLLERNAQYDSLGLLSSMAWANGHDDIAGVFNSMRNTFAVAGYTDNNDGALINTLKDIHLGDKLKSMDFDFESLDMNTRFRLGLPVDDHTRERILTLR